MYIQLYIHIHKHVYLSSMLSPCFGCEDSVPEQESRSQTPQPEL